MFIVLVFFSLVAWAQQGMATNQFKSSKFSGYYCDIGGVTYSLAEISLNARGWSSNMSLWEPFAFLVPFTLVFGVFTWLALKLIRIEPDRQYVKKTVNIGSIKETEELSIPFTPADIFFDNLVYEVTASTASDTLRLLNEVSGVFRAGRMCALMGSSGGMIWLLFRTSFDLSLHFTHSLCPMKFAAGKTTLMDVIAMRKTSGSITGKIELNGFEQERISFLRSSGYVEQFDVQQPELTVRETVSFSARLRLDVNNPAIGDDEGKMKFVDYVLSTMELMDIQCLQVGSFEEGGKSSIRYFAVADHSRRS